MTLQISFSIRHQVYLLYYFTSKTRFLLVFKFNQKTFPLDSTSEKVTCFLLPNCLNKPAFIFAVGEPPIVLLLIKR